ncbi:PGF-pre-PGF domain-containing protein [Halobaculum rubrum]|uniref:PGF-pre-PGF domain-containing protein n=1 Tax=Halobaculum rubrum TaxID=2872158 RepID=UPI001CA44716|nr:PGF-pre-PGF domain-containing protein [Halobaculum rubrum]QZX98983.1 PGF-pre-PGF domain-containing protein [Halobaculum rubrum]
MRRLAAALAALALAGALVFPSAAASFSLAVDPIGNDVDLSPTDDPNGDYAYLDDNDELVVDLTATNTEVDGEGVNDDGVTTISNVFEIRYNGSRYAHVWITHGSEQVTLVARGDPIESESANVTLGPNGSVAVGIVVDTTGETPDGLIDDMQVHAKVADPEDVNGGGDGGGGTGGIGAAGVGSTADTDDGDEADAGDDGDDGAAVQQFARSDAERSVTILDPPTAGPVTVDLDGMAIDGGPGNLTLDAIDVTAADSSTVSLNITAGAPGTASDSVGVEALGVVAVTETDGSSVEDATLRFSVDRDHLEERGIALDDLAVFRERDGETATVPVRVVGERDGRVVFEADAADLSTFTVAALRPSIGVAEASLSTDAVAATGSATVTARVVNEGRTAGTRTVTLTLDGEPVAERTVDLDANESTSVTFEVTPDGTGDYAVAVDGASVGTLTVEGDAGTAEPSESVDTVGESAGAGTADGVAADVTDAPVEEPAGLGLVDVAGLASLAALTASLVVLVRRISR